MIINDITSNSTYCENNVDKTYKKGNNTTIFSHRTLFHISLFYVSLHVRSTPKHLCVSLQAHYTHSHKLRQDFTHDGNNSRST